MTGFALDFENTFDGGNIADGTYEVLITQTSEGATKSGSEYAEFRLTVRNDIDQKHKNQIVFHKVWKAKDTGKYNMASFNTIGKFAQLQKGKTYTSLEDLLNDYVGRPLKVTVKNETSDYNGQTYENLNVKGWDVTKFPNVQHVAKNNDKDNQTVGEMISNGITVSEDDLPF